MNHVPHTCLQEAGAAKGENDFHSNEKKLTDALQTTAEDVLGHADDSEKHEGRVRVAALQTQEHGRAAVLTRLGEPRRDSPCGIAVRSSARGPLLHEILRNTAGFRGRCRPD